MAEEKTDEKAEYFRILDLSKEERSLKNWDTNQKIADHIGTSTNSLQKWREKRGSGGANEDFDMRLAFLNDRKVIWDAFMGAVKSGKINAQLFRTFAQLANELVERKEETVKLELTANDRTRIARETINGLRENYQRDGGYCPVCSRPEALRLDAHLDTEPEHTEGGEVATVGISARPD